VRVEFFGVLEEIAGKSAMELDIAENATVSDVLTRLSRDLPDLAPRLPRVACAFGDELVSRSARVARDSVLVLLPPVSGG